MIFIPKQKHNTSKEIEELLLLSSSPRNVRDKELNIHVDAKEEFLQRFNLVDSSLQLSFLKRFLLYIIRKRFYVLLEFYMEGQHLTIKQEKSTL